VRENDVKARLARGETAIGTMVFEFFVPALPRLMADEDAAQDDYERASTPDKIEALNARTFIIAQIESPAGLENLDALASIDGIDCLWVGHNDLSIQMGIPGQFNAPAFQDAITRVADVCDRHGKPAGVMVGDPAGAADWMSKGYRALAYGADFRVFADGLKTGIDAVRKLVPANGRVR
jgi:2-dehydro-3-deoxyglucarate aldolase/4-hydroxy-2-oxoheptanedioate aldolase